MEYVLGSLVILGMAIAIWRLGDRNVTYANQLVERDRHIRKLQQEINQLQQATQNWQEVLRQAPIGYLQVDAENRLFWCNAVVSRLLGIEEDCTDERDPKRLLLHTIRSYELDRLIAETRNTGHACDREWVFHRVTPDPTQLVQQQDLPLKGFSIPLPEREVGIFLENCSEKANLKLQRDRWASDVAHELKTPLTSIRLVAETLQSRVDPATREWLDRLLNETIRLSNLVQDLLDLGQLDIEVPHTLHTTSCDLANLVRYTWLSLEPLAAKKKIQLEYLGNEPFPLQADASRLHRLLLNLLDNAIKHSPSLGNVVVNAERLSDQKVRFEVIDSGEGFPEASLPLVFDRFYRVDRSRARSDAEQGGSGLGLAIVQQIVLAHGGTVTAGNHPDTGGGWIIVTLPQQVATTIAGATMV